MDQGDDVTLLKTIGGVTRSAARKARALARSDEVIPGKNSQSGKVVENFVDPPEEYGYDRIVALNPESNLFRIRWTGY